MKKIILSSVAAISAATILAGCSGSSTQDTTSSAEGETTTASSTLSGGVNEFVMPEYKMAIIDSNENYVSVAIYFEAYDTEVSNVELATTDGEVVSTERDYTVYYTDPGIDENWYSNIVESTKDGNIQSTSYSAHSKSYPTYVMRYSVSGDVDVSKLCLKCNSVSYIGQNTVPANSTIKQDGEFEFTANANVTDLPLDFGLALGHPMFCEDGAYYMIPRYSAAETSGGSNGLRYRGRTTNFFAISEPATGIHIADMHLIDSRTMEDYVLPDNVEAYFSGNYDAQGRATSASGKDANLTWGISTTVLSKDEIDEVWEEVSKYAIFGYESDNGLVKFLYEVR